MPEQPLLSVIIPVYNSAGFLRPCMDSVLDSGEDAQLEVILVDDGSCDGSSQVCDAYAEKDERVRVIHQKNGGASTARNTGISG